MVAVNKSVENGFSSSRPPSNKLEKLVNPKVKILTLRLLKNTKDGGTDTRLQFVRFLDISV